MNRYIIGSLWDRANRNGANKNFEYLFEGRQKIDELNYRADGILTEAQKTNDMNKNVQQQINTLIAESGTSDTEVVQARIDSEGNEHDVLKTRLDEKEQNFSTQLANNDIFIGEGFGKTAKPNPKHPTGNGFITIVDDDGRKEVWSRLLPLSIEYNIPITVAMPVKIGGVPKSEMLTKEQLLILQNEHGWEIASHGYNHIALHGASVETVEYELIESKKELTSWGLDIKNYVAPFGHVEEPLIREVASKYYNTSSRAQGLPNTRPIRNHYLNRVAVGSYAGTGQNTLDYYKEKVDEAKNGDRWLVIMTHVWDSEHDETQHNLFKQMIEHAQSEGVPFGNLQEGFERYGNMIEVSGVTSIGNDGTPFGFRKHNMYTKASPGVQPHNIMLNTIPSALREHHSGNVVETIFYLYNDQDFPESKAGTLITHVLETTDRIWQEWIPDIPNNPSLYIRKALNENEWSEFKQVNEPNSVYTKADPGANPYNIMLNTTPATIREHHWGKVVEVNYNLANDQDFPESKAGTLITHALTGTDMIWQEWHPYQKPHRVYYRHALTNGTGWSSFKRSDEA